jgi:hypothetical protein
VWIELNPNESWVAYKQINVSNAPFITWHVNDISHLDDKVMSEMWIKS